MPASIITYDNSVTSDLILSDGQWKDLSQLCGRTVGSLCSNDDDGSLLIFPTSLNEYGDEISDCIIADIENGNRIRTYNMMGFVGAGDVEIKIKSRFDKSQHDYLMHYMLERVFAVNLFDLQHSTSNEALFDFVLFLFPYFLNKALAQGLYKEYRTFRRNDAHIKGVLDVNRHIRTNLYQTGNIAYNSRENTTDNDLIQLIRHTIEFIRSKEFGEGILYRDEFTRTSVQQIINTTETYNRNNRESIISKNLRPRIHPYYSAYEDLRQLCIRILRHEQIKYGNNKEKVYGILFDGAWLWEEYLNTLLHRCGFRHPKNRENTGRIYLFSPNAAPRYPDFIKDGYILDAKYKGYSGKSPQEMSREDLAQVISYMYVECAENGGIIVPGGTIAECRSSALRGYGGKMHIFNLPISKAESYHSFTDEMVSYEKAFIELMSMN
jgi:5-methylcytosine-specific restriction endonuclease McrBC regulatory subunit McrC